MSGELYICTNASFAAGSPRLLSVCQICLRENELYLSYVVEYCELCGYTTSIDDWLGRRAEMRRNYLELTRKEVAQRFGLFLATISYYETKRCSKKYYQRLGGMIQKIKKVKK